MFRFYLVLDNYNEWKKVSQEQKEETEEKTKERNAMEIEELEGLLKLFITPIERLLDECTGSVKEFKGVNKILKTNVPVGGLHQQFVSMG